MQSAIPLNERFLDKAIRFCENIDAYIEILGLDPIKVTAFKGNQMLLDFALRNQVHFSGFNENSLDNGVANLEISLQDLIEQCKKSKNYSLIIGKELGIEEPLDAGNDNPFLPRVKVEYTRDGNPKLTWENGAFEEVEIWKDSGDKKGYRFVKREPNQQYIDTSPWPEYGERRIWKYSIRYVYKGSPIENWRREIKIVAEGKEELRAK